MRSTPFVNSQIRAGVWEAEIAGTADRPPAVSVTYLDTLLEGLTTTYDESRAVWRISVPIPPAVISAGVQTLVMGDASGATLGTLSVVAGEPSPDDLRTEVALLRQELDLLKSAFRSHCAEK